MSIDYYAEAEAIAQILAGHGLSTEATSLRDAIESGSTATEILMALRWRLSELVRTGSLPDEFTENRTRKLIAELNKELD
jgi:hypothetical protein